MIKLEMTLNQILKQMTFFGVHAYHINNKKTSQITKLTVLTVFIIRKILLCTLSQSQVSMINEFTTPDSLNVKLSL